MTSHQPPLPGPRPDPTRPGSAEYRARLINKLTCLIAVLEVAVARLSGPMEGSSERRKRLLKIRANLENTLAICRRARGTLQGSEAAAGQPKSVEASAQPEPPAVRRMTMRDYVEFSSVEEYRRFRGLPPIRRSEVAGVDLEKLARLLQG